MWQAPGGAPTTAQAGAGTGTIFLLALQALLTLVILAWLPGATTKLIAFLAVWLVTFRTLTIREVGVYVAACALFSAMDVMAVRQGVFRFAAPDYLGLPLWEFFMWGFYVLHLVRVLAAVPPARSSWKALVLALVFAGPFLTLSDPQALLFASAALLAVALLFFHEPGDLAYLGYMLTFGALIEYCGVWSGQWSYPGQPFGGVPPWFATMWGGVGLFSRRLVAPLLQRRR